GSTTSYNVVVTDSGYGNGYDTPAVSVAAGAVQNYAGIANLASTGSNNGVTFTSSEYWAGSGSQGWDAATTPDWHAGSSSGPPVEWAEGANAYFTTRATISLNFTAHPAS